MPFDAAPTSRPSTDRPRARAAWAALATLVLLVGLTEVALRVSPLGRGLRAETLYVAKPDAYAARPEADVIIIGDSRILHGFHPVVAEQVIAADRGETVRAWNAGLSGAPPMAHLAWVRRALGQTHKPKLVVISISPYMFGTKIVHDAARESLATFWRVRDVPALLRAGGSLDDAMTVVTDALFDLFRFRPRILEAVFHGAHPGPKADLGLQGWLDGGFVDAGTQAARAKGRGDGYHQEIHKPEATLTNEHRGYFEEALRELQAAGVRTVVLNSPSASQVVRRYTPDTLYAEHIAYVQAQCRRFGATWVDAMQAPVVDDTDFTDGDHLSGTGAERWTAWLTHTHLVPALGPLPQAPVGCHVVEDFEADLPGSWTTTDLTDPRVQGARQHQHALVGMSGQHAVTTFGPRGEGDKQRGTLTSPPLPPGLTAVGIRVAGGDSAETAVELLVDGQTVQRAHGQRDEILRPVRWDVTPYAGHRLQVRIRDEATGDWGHINADALLTCP